MTKIIITEQQFGNCFQSFLRPQKSGIIPFRRKLNNEIEVLLGLPGEPKEPHNSNNGFYGIWNYFKGHTDGQDAKTAAIREFCEETSLTTDLINDDNLYDLGALGAVYTYALDVTDYNIDIHALHSNMVTDLKGFEPFPEIGEYGWFSLPFNVKVHGNVMAAIHKIKESFCEK